MAVSAGMLLYGAALLAIFLSALYAGLSAAPYLPTRWRDVRRAFDLADLQPEETVADLGCGDGRFLVEAARRGAHAVGYEVSVLPFLWAWLRIRFAGKLPGSARVRFQSFYGVDLRTVDVVVCFLTPPAMQRLSTKVVRELKPGSRLLSVAFHLPGLEPVSNDYPGGTHSRIFVYRSGHG